VRSALEAFWGARLGRLSAAAGLVRLVHSDLAPEVRPLHAEGWSRFLPRPAAVVAGRDPGKEPARTGPPPSLGR